MSSNRNKALDGLRGIAVVFVILYHYTIRFEELYYPMYQINVFKYGGEIGVGIFFILSGLILYFITMNIKVLFTSIFVGLSFYIFPPYIFYIIILG